MRGKRDGQRLALRRLLAMVLLGTALTAVLARTPAAHAAVTVDNICRLRFTVTTGNDGIRDDSRESIVFGGQPVIFLDSNGDGVVDANGGRRFHQGGTGDTGSTTFVWDTRLDPCVPATKLLDGFRFEHFSVAGLGGPGTDDWDLKSLVVANPDRVESLPFWHIFQYYNKSGDPLHHFGGIDEVVVPWNTTDGEPPADTDHDGLTDADELLGYVPQPGQPLDQWLPQHGADPCQRTIAVEIDWLVDDNNVSDKPSDKAINDAIQMFADAPIYPDPFNLVEQCPYYQHPPPPGIQLLTNLSDDIHVTANQRKMPLSTQVAPGTTVFDQYRDGVFGGGFTPGRKGRFFYSLWGYSWNNSSTTGHCCLGGGEHDGDHANDFVITLGKWANNGPLARTDRVQSADFVHELGHQLGLKHSGDRSQPNFKPNYLSVMNYRYSTFGLPDYDKWQQNLTAALTRPPTNTEFDFSPGSIAMQNVLEQSGKIDYSREVLPTLPRTPESQLLGTDIPPRWRLDESKGVGSSSRTAIAWYDPTGTLRVGPASGGLDWDWSNNGTPDPQPTSDNVNIMSGREPCVTPGPTPALETTPIWDDTKVGTTITAGPDGKCQTTPDPNDMLATRTANFNYPKEWGYESGLDGFNDWNHLRFPVGVSPDAAAPMAQDDNDEPTEADQVQALAELVKGFLVATHLYDPGPPAHGRLIDSLDPSYTAGPQASLFFYTARTFNPREVTFEPKAFPGLLSAVLPYLRQPDDTPRRYQLACHVTTSATNGTVFRLTGGTPSLAQRRWVPPGDVTVRFPTETISRMGWYYWTLTSDQNDPWTFKGCDVYEVTDDGPAPAAAPAPHPAPPAVQPPTIATLNARYTQTPIAELAMANAYSLGAAQGASFQPSLTNTTETAQFTLTTDANAHTYRINCHLHSAADARYSLDGQTVAASAGDTAVSFAVSTQQAGPHTWTLTELNQVTWVLKSCDINESP